MSSPISQKGKLRTKQNRPVAAELGQQSIPALPILSPPSCGSLRAKAGLAQMELSEVAGPPPLQQGLLQGTAAPHPPGAPPPPSRCHPHGHPLILHFCPVSTSFGQQVSNCPSPCCEVGEAQPEGRVWHPERPVGPRESCSGGTHQSGFRGARLARSWGGRDTCQDRTAPAPGHVGRQGTEAESGRKGGRKEGCGKRGWKGM